MRSHAVVTARTLYEAGTLTLEQAARQAGLTTDQLAAQVSTSDVDPTDDLDRGDSPVIAD